MDPDSEAILAFLKATPPDQPTPRPGYNSTERQARRIFGGDARVKKPLTRLERLLLPPSRPFTRQDVESAGAWAQSWEDYSFTYSEVESWLRCGLYPSESSLAASLVGEGITPDRLSEPVTHPDTGERLTVLDVARRMPEARAYNRDATLCDLLDQAGVERTRGTPLIPEWLRRRPGA